MKLNLIFMTVFISIMIGIDSEASVSKDEIYLKALYPQINLKTQKVGRPIDTGLIPQDGCGKQNPYEKIDNIQVVDLPFVKGITLALATTRLYCGEIETPYYQADFAVFSDNKASESNLKLIRKLPVADKGDEFGNVKPWLIRDDSNGVSYSFKLSFDLAHYDIKQDDRAFGYRLFTKGHHTNAEDKSETLNLFHIVNGEVSSVLSLKTQSQHAFQDLMNPSDSEKPSVVKKIVLVSSQIKNSSFVWKIKSNSVFYKNFEKFNRGVSESKKSSEEQYIWNGSGYAPEKL